MSKTIDEKIVSMQFENERFEKNVEQSMSTLDKLKKSLHLDGAAKSLETIETASKNCDISSLSNAVETVKVKFSALQVVGVTVLANLANSAVNCGKQIVKSIAVDQITAGFSKYEKKTASVQTIMNATGESIGRVNEYLEELMWYSDETSYSFSDMISALGSLTSAGGDVQKMIPMIEGMANATAFAGKGATEFSRVIYNLNQAYGNGVVQLNDWKSVELAGVGTSKQLREEIIKAAIALGTLDKNGRTAKGTLVTIGNLNKSLDEKWFTGKVMEEAFGNFAELSRAAYKLVDAGEYDTAADAMEALSGKYSKLSEDAFKAAQTAKTYTEVIAATKDAVSSGWMNTFEIIFGNLEKASLLWTEFGGNVWEIFASGIEGRNDFLADAMNSKWEILVSKMDDAGVSMHDYYEKLKKVSPEVAKIVKEEGSLSRAMASGRISTDLMIAVYDSLETKSGKTAKATKRLSDKLIKFQDIVSKAFGDETLSAADSLQILEDAGYDFEEVQGLITETLKGNVLSFDKLSYSQLESLGYTEEQIIAIRDLGTQAERTGTPISQLIEDLNTPSGRDLIFGTINNLLIAIADIMKTVKTSFSEVFKLKPQGLYDILKAINKLSEKFILSTKTTDDLRRTFKGLFAILDILNILITRPLIAGVKLLGKLFGVADFNVLEFTGNIGDSIIKFRDFLDENYSASKALEFFTIWIKKGIDKLKELFEIFKLTPKFQEFIKEFLKLKNIKIDFNFSKIKEIAVNLIDGLRVGIKDGIPKIISSIVELGTKLINAIKKVLGIQSPSKVMIAIGGMIVSGLIIGLLTGIPSVSEAVQTFASTIIGIFSSIDWTQILSFGLAAALLGAIYMVKKLSDTIGQFSAPFKSFAKLIDSVTSLVKDASKSFIKVLGGLSSALKGYAFKLRAEGIKEIAIALGILVASVVALAYFMGKDPNATKNLAKSVALIAVLAGILALFAFGLNKLAASSASIDMKSKSIKMQGLSSILGGISRAILLISVAIKTLGKLQPDQLKEGMNALIKIMIMLTLVLAAWSKVTNGSMLSGVDSKSSEKLGATLLKIAAAIVIMALVVKYLGMMSEAQLDQGLTVMYKFSTILGVLGLVNKIGKNTLPDTAKSLLLMSGAFVLLAATIKILGELSLESLLKGGAVITGFLGVITALMFIMRLGKETAQNLGKTLLCISGAMLILAFTIKILGDLSIDKLLKGAAAILVFVGLISLLTLVSRNGSKDLTNLGKTLIAMSVAIAIMAAVAIVLSLLKPEKLAKGIIAVGVLGLVMALMARAAKDAAEAQKTVKAMALVIAVMAASIVALYFLKDTKRLMAAVASLSIIMGMFALVVKSSKNVKDVTSTIVAMTAAIAVMAGGIYLLSLIDAGKAITSALSISVLMGAMVGVLYALNDLKRFNKKKLGFLAILEALIAGLAGIVLLLGYFAGDTAIQSALSLSLLLVVMVDVLDKLNSLSKIGKDTKKKIGVLALLGAVVLELAVIIGVLSLLKPESALESALALSVLLLALVASLKILDDIKTVSATVIGTLAILAGVVGAIGLIVGLLEKYDLAPSIESAKALSILLLAMSAACLILTAVGAAGPSALIGAAVLVGVIAILTGFLAGLGILMEKLPNIEEFVDKAIPLLKKVATGIGEFLGTLVTSFLGSITKSLPQMGKDLSDFASELQPFIDSVKSIDATAITGVNNLAEMLYLLTKNNVLKGMTSWFTGDTAITDFTASLEPLANGMVAFSKTLVDGNINGQAIKDAGEAGKSIADMYKKLPKSGGWIQKAFGTQQDLETFGTGLKFFGEAIVDFSNTIGITPINVVEIQNAAKAGSAIAEMTKGFVKCGGFVQDVFGTPQSMETFCTNMTTFAKTIVGVSQIVSGKINKKDILDAAAGGTAIVKMANELPNIGGILKKLGITGEKSSLTDFGVQMTTFARDIVTFSTTVKDINTENMNIAIAYSNKLVNFANTVADCKIFTSGYTLKDFGKQLLKYASQLISFYDSIAVDINWTIFGEAIASSALIADFAASLSGYDFSTLNTFSKNLKDLGPAIKDFYNKTKDLDSTKINTVATGCSKLASVVISTSYLDFTGITNFFNSLGTMGDSLNKLGTLSVDSYLQEILSSAPKIEAAGHAMVKNLVSGVSSEVVKTGNGSLFQCLSSGISKGLAKSLKSLTTELKKSLSTAEKEIRKYYESFKKAGEYLGDGLIKGLNNKKTAVTNAAKSLGSEATKGANKGAVVKSPSRATMKTGRFIGEGLIIGMGEKIKQVSQTGIKMGQVATESIGSVMSRIKGSDINVEPTVRPIVDMSNATPESVNFGANVTAYLTKPIDSLSQVIANAQTEINNSNHEVVSAISALRDDLNRFYDSDDKEIALYVDGQKVASTIAKPMNRQLNILLKRGAYR